MKGHWNKNLQFAILAEKALKVVAQFFFFFWGGVVLATQC